MAGRGIMRAGARKRASDAAVRPAQRAVAKAARAARFQGQLSAHGHWYASPHTVFCRIVENAMPQCGKAAPHLA